KPTYEPAVKLEAGGKPLDVFGMPTPNLADFDGDGDLDILCGSFVDSLTYFQNTGTRTKPQYAAGRPLMHDGKPLTMDLCMIVPTAIDWDKDGDVDLVVGEEDGRVALVEHTGKVVDGVPVFLPQQQFQQQADCVKFGALATPVSVDWDGDGDEDIVSGNTAGYIGFIENLDGGNPPKWAKPVTLEADGKVIRVEAGPNGSIQGPCEAKWGYTTISVADWDHDGLPDIVANSIWGKVHWYRNAGARTAPKLSAARPIEVEWTGKPPKPAWNWWNPEGKALATQWRTTPVVIDLNKDGLNDLVMLDHEGTLALYERRKVAGNLVLLPPKRVFRDARKPSEPLRLNSRSAGGSGRRKLCFADWDRDGTLDLLANSRNVDLLRTESVKDGIWTLRNMGTVDARRLAGHTTSPTICDWDKDGKPELLVGAEDGFFYHMETPYPIARRPVKKPAEHLVAAWDFEAGKGGPLADKATAGQVKDALKPLGDVKVEKGVAIMSGTVGSAYRAESSADLELGDELTLWIRFRIEKANHTHVSLVDKRRFSKPEERSYGLYIPPDRKTPTLFGVGGQVSATGTGSGSVAMANARETLPVGKWREVAMIVSRRTHFLSVRWLGSSKENPTAAGEFVQVAGPVSSPALTRIFRSKQPLLIGNDVGLGAHEVALEIDEVRLYDRALAASELAAIEPGELSK
ncbi:VCBS repeat-containing protein, partial [bacterium]|nr:VCBS repeat-containing protein [bacterium]